MTEAGRGARKREDARLREVLRRAWEGGYFDVPLPLDGYIERRRACEEAWRRARALIGRRRGTYIQATVCVGNVIKYAFNIEV